MSKKTQEIRVKTIEHEGEQYASLEDLQTIFKAMEKKGETAENKKTWRLFHKVLAKLISHPIKY